MHAHPRAELAIRRSKGGPIPVRISRASAVTARGRQPGNAVLTSLDLGSRARIVLSYRGLHNLTPTSILMSYCPFEYPKPRSW
jgi:hypothetical protein